MASHRLKQDTMNVVWAVICFLQTAKYWGHVPASTGFATILWRAQHDSLEKETLDGLDRTIENLGDILRVRSLCATKRPGIPLCGN